jgi:hypothetical protein
MKKYVINILCVLILLLLLADFVVDMFFSSSHGVTIVNLDDFSLGALLILLLLFAVALGAAVMAVVYFIRFILNVNRNQVFTEKNVSLLRKYGVCGLLVGVAFAIITTTIIEGTSFFDALLECIDALGEGLFALLMAEVFDIGLRLQGKKSTIE